jgi:hypothetical protein
MSVHGSAPRRRELPVEEESTLSIGVQNLNADLYSDRSVCRYPFGGIQVGLTVLVSLPLILHSGRAEETANS